jgi:hypothetical protein
MASLYRNEEVRRIACRIFREPYYLTTHARRGDRFLSEPLYGPPLKSHWPLRLKELTNFWRSPFSTEIPLPKATRYANIVSRAYNSLPFPLHRVYRLSIGEWRFNRGKNVKKGKLTTRSLHLFLGESKVTATNLGKIGKK